MKVFILIVSLSLILINVKDSHSQKSKPGKATNKNSAQINREAVPELLLKLKNDILDVKISPDGQYCGIQTKKDLVVYSISEYSEEITYKSHFFVNEEVNCFEFSPDCKNILVGYEKNKFTLYDINLKKIISKFNSDNYYDVSSIRFSPDGNLILLIHAGWYSGSLDMLELSTHKLIYSFNPQGGVVSAEYSPDGKFIFCGGIGYIYTIDSKDGRVICESDFINGGQGVYLKYSDNLNHIISVVSFYNFYRLYLFDPNNCKVSRTIKYDYPVNGLSISPDGKVVAFELSNDNVSDLYSLNLQSNNTSKLFKIDYPGWNFNFEFSPDFKYSLFSSNNNLYMFNFATYSKDSKLYSKYFSNYLKERNDIYDKLTPRKEFETLAEFFTRIDGGVESLVITRKKYSDIISSEADSINTSQYNEYQNLQSEVNSSVRDTIIGIQSVGYFNIDQLILPIKINNEENNIHISSEEAKILKERYKEVTVKAKKRLKYNLKDWEIFEIVIIHPTSFKEYVFKK